MSVAEYRPVALRTFRILMKQCRTLSRVAVPCSSEAGGAVVLLQSRLDPADVGRSQMYTQRPVVSVHEAREDLYRFFADCAPLGPEDGLALYDWLEDLLGGWDRTLGAAPPPSHWTSLPVLRDAIRHAYREAPPVPATAAPRDGALRTQWAIALYRLLRAQCAAQGRTSVSEAPRHGLRVVATSQFVGRALAHVPRDRPRPVRGGGGGDDDDDDLPVPQFRFAYRIRVENRGTGDDAAVQLLGRTWRIQETSATGAALGEPVLVHAPRTGAVGQLPVLRPGDVFEYISQCQLVSPTGEMQVCTGRFFGIAHLPVRRRTEDANLDLAGMRRLH